MLSDPSLTPSLVHTLSGGGAARCCWAMLLPTRHGHGAPRRHGGHRGLCDPSQCREFTRGMGTTHLGVWCLRDAASWPKGGRGGPSWRCLGETGCWELPPGGVWLRGDPKPSPPPPQQCASPPPDTGGAPSAGGKERCGAAPRTAAGTPRAAQPIPTAPRKKRPPPPPRAKPAGCTPPSPTDGAVLEVRGGGGTPKRGARPEIGGNEGRLQG